MRLFAQRPGEKSPEYGLVLRSRWSRGLAVVRLLTSARLEADQPQHTCGVDDPSSVPARMRFLAEKLGACCLAAEEDAATVDFPVGLSVCWPPDERRGALSTEGLWKLT